MTVRFFVATSLRDMQLLLDRFKATSRLSNNAHKQLSKQLDVARRAEANGNDTRAIRELRTFITHGQQRRPWSRRPRSAPCWSATPRR